MQWHTNIRVNAIGPGVVGTERVLAMLDPETNPIAKKSLMGVMETLDIAYMALYLASDESKRITGAILPAESGASRTEPATCFENHGTDDGGSWPHHPKTRPRPYFMACKPKTGNTFIRRVLQRYWQRLGLRGKNSRWGGVGEKTIDLDTSATACARAYAASTATFCRTSGSSIRPRSFSFRVLVLERNMWDCMISWVDHQTQFEDSPREKIEMDFILGWSQFFLDFSVRRAGVLACG